MKSYIALWLALLSLPVFADIITTPGKPIVGINSGDHGKRVCYYQDQAYSDGSILQVGEYFMICANANDFESNSAMKWQRLDKHENATPKAEASNPPLKRFSVK
ncbi:hypothetical protein TW81_09270 [Vibrio galatheae]|uniref:DUF1496 domain-containing protein n=1 Tax=Vibrio galatheae TaxID=579748 RepID=A0A0F4NJ60_9VIBR|nr:DUF1496 domain-containing protein [Vibrio galatheae]KJY83190.1 hypothetical protein TW81_09270 [Vibrio galatheae]